MSDEVQKLGGNVEIKKSTIKPRRIAGLFWGSAGTGKTTLACTAPGRKLLVNFDPDGDASVGSWEDIDVADYVGTPTSICDKFKDSDPLGIGRVLDQYDTVVVDSLTNIGYKALMHGVSQVKGATVERPSPGAYQIRNSLVLAFVKNMLALTSKANKHLIFIAHEAAPMTNEEGVVMHITLSLGGQLPEQTALDFSEVWCVQDMGVGRDRRIMFRPARSRKPCKTRMFDTSGDPEFQWQFDPEEQEGMKIADWYDEWVAGGQKKIALPKPVKKK